ncbi:nose resistant to fluoxetine protein 6-like [Xylocopa sonorina]|uniref:nose resistant to fluoxetine protein 6-like n=1 Tax=Xylocopa sonorina TaxID=1818115 RepID=UPI00403B0AD9
MSHVMPVYALTNYLDLLNSSKCSTEMQQFREAVDSNVFWSLRMLDASGVPYHGFLNGNNYWTGSLLDCNFLSANITPRYSPRNMRKYSHHRNVDEQYPPFELTFFMTSVRHDSTLQYQFGLLYEDVVMLGLCLPATCTKNEIATMLNEMLNNNTLLVGHIYGANFTLLDIYDMKDDHRWLLRWDIMTIIFILSLLCVIMIAGTVYDIMVHQKSLRKKKEFLTYGNNNTSEMNTTVEGRREFDHEETIVPDLKARSLLGRYLLCFSFYTNIQLIFNTEGNRSNIPVFHGIKFLGMLWIVMGHTLYFGKFYLANKTTLYEMIESFIAHIFSNATYSVDTYFFISGFLLCYVFLKEQDKKMMSKGLKSKVSQFFGAIVKRYIRITPAYVIVLMLTILNFTWHSKISIFSDTVDLDKCSKYWWRNLLFINNFFKWDEICLEWSWYLSNDMQYFIFGSFLLVLSITHYNYALCLGIISLSCSIFLNGYLTFVYSYIPTLDEQYQMLDVFYMKPWLRIGPYLVGMATALLLKKWNYKLRLSKVALAACWMIAILCNCSILFGPGEQQYTFAGSILYVALSRTAWGLGMAWLIIVCTTNNGGIVTKFLSLDMWIPLSRITYCIYLLNPFIIYAIFKFGTYPLSVDVLTIGAISIGLFVSTILCAILLSVFAEAPYIQLLRISLNSPNRLK